jgi:hypothetical protein
VALRGARRFRPVSLIAGGILAPATDMPQRCAAWQNLGVAAPPPDEPQQQVELPAGPSGCGAESSLQGHRRGLEDDDALSQTRLGRLILKVRAVIHLLAGARPGGH